MRFRDLVGLALFALARHKVRTVLTTLGVLFGTLVLVVSLAIRLGVQNTIVRQVGKYVELRRIEVRPAAGVPASDAKPFEGRLGDQRRERLQQERERRQGRRGDAPPEGRLTPARVRELAALEHVSRIQPLVYSYGRASLGDRREYASFLALPVEERDRVAGRLIAGEMLAEGDRTGILVSEWLLYHLGVVDDADVPGAVGRTLHFEVPLDDRPKPSLLLRLLTGSGDSVRVGEEDLLGKVLKRLPDSLDRLGLTDREQETMRRLLSVGSKKPVKEKEVRASYTVRGVLRAPTNGEMSRHRGWMWQHTDLVLSAGAGEAFFLRLPHSREHGFDQVVIEVDDLDNVRGVQDRIVAMGLNADSAVDHIEREQFLPRIGVTALTVVALIALLVSAIGITNTMLMSVLERVREIGILKAVGAHDGQIQGLFLMEGALIGAVGGLLGLAAAWGVSYPADAYLHGQVAEMRTIQLDSSLFAFPWWLLLGAPAFAVGVTTLAALYPARRAVHIDPVQALRHE